MSDRDEPGLDDRADVVPIELARRTVVRPYVLTRGGRPRRSACSRCTRRSSP